MIEISSSLFFSWSSWSQFAVIGHDILVQLRHILEEDPKDGESRVFTMARNFYKVSSGSLVFLAFLFLFKIDPMFI